MPAVSKTQQRLMGMVHAYEKGDLDISKLPKVLQDKIKGIADDMKNKDTTAFAKTKHTGLPEEVPENYVVDENTLTDLPDDVEYGYTRDGVMQCIASKNTCLTRMRDDRERNPGSKFQFIYSPTFAEGEIYEGSFQGSISNDARSLTPGTIASLTGKTNSSELQKIQNDFVKFSMKNKTKYKDWHSAWVGFWKKDEVNEGQSEFVAFYNGKKISISGSDLWDAKQKAIKQLKIPKSKQGLLAIKSVKSMEKGDFRFEGINEVKSDKDMVKDGLRYAKKKYNYTAKDMKELAKDTLQYINSGEIDDQASMEAYVDFRHDEKMVGEIKETIRSVVKEILNEGNLGLKNGTKVLYINNKDKLVPAKIKDEVGYNQYQIIDDDKGNTQVLKKGKSAKKGTYFQVK